VSTGCVIGVDLGGAKLSAGAVDPALNVHHRATRPARGPHQAAVLDTIRGAVREVRGRSEDVRMLSAIHPPSSNGARS
jgi:glucokinase